MAYIGSTTSTLCIMPVKHVLYKLTYLFSQMYAHLMSCVRNLGGKCMHAANSHKPLASFNVCGWLKVKLIIKYHNSFKFSQFR
jgi:long-subunit acyl-CoA synthetase (AMP-forming)